MPSPGGGAAVEAVVLAAAGSAAALAQVAGRAWLVALAALLAGALIAAAAAWLAARRRMRAGGGRPGAIQPELLDALPLAIYGRDAQGRFVLANRAAAEAFGVAPEEMIGKTDQELGRTDPVVERGLQDDQRALRTGEPALGLAEMLIYPDGSTHQFQTTRIPCTDCPTPLVVSVSVDLTEQRQAEEALKQSEAAMEGLLVAAPIGIGLIAEDTLGWTNQHVSAMTGYSRDELMGQPLRLLFPSDPEHQRITRQCAQLDRGGTAAAETRLRRKDGSLVDVLWSCSVLRRAGAAANLVFTAVDISQQKEAQAALRASQQYNRTLFDQSTIGLVVSRMDGRIMDANPAFAAIVGRMPAEAVRLAFADITPPEAGMVFQAQSQSLSRAGRYGPIETELLHKDGRLVPVRMSGQLLERAGEPFVLSSVEDITERRRLEEQLRHAQKMEAVGQLAGGVAHDFNNQLTVIQGYCDLLLRGRKGQDPQYTPLAEIRRASERAKRLTSQLLAFSRKHVLRAEVLDLRGVLTEMTHSLGRIVGERVEVSIHVPARLDPVKLDRSLLEQALMNLVINARDAMPAGGRVTIEADNVQLTRRYTSLHPEAAPGDYVALSVSDTGVGMDEPTRRHVFDPFFTTKEVGKGTGLGLSMVYGFVKQSGGTVNVYSEPGQGSTFRLYLPTTAEAQAQTVKGRALRLARGSETVLVVEDEQSVRDFVVRVLRQCGYTVLAAGDGPEALGLAARHEGAIDVLLTDIVMPGMTGPELADRARATRPDMKILYMTGYAPSTVAPEGESDASAQMLIKPFSPEVLSHAVREALDRVTNVS